MTEQEGFIEAITDRDRALKGLTDEIEIMRYEVEAVLAIKVERDALATTLAAIEIKVDALIVERDDYAAAADTMAASHKVERDALKSENGSLRELMNTYNIGGWTDALSLIEERGSLKKAAKFALDALEYHTAQTRPIERTQIAIAALKAVL